MADSAAQSENLMPSREAEAPSSFNYLKLIVWISATAASWIAVIALWRLAAALML